MTQPATLRFFMFGTTCAISVWAPPGQAAQLLAGGRASAEKARRMLDMYDPCSELSRLCAGYAVGRPAPVSPALFGFLAALDKMHRETGGVYDSTCGPLVQAWDFMAREPAAPAPETLEAARACVGMRHLRLDAARNTVTFGRAGMRIDPGSAGKGYAVQLVADYLQAQGLSAAAIDFGGNLCFFGECPGGWPDGWRVAVQQPNAPRGVPLGLLHLAGQGRQGVSTSGVYDRFFTAGDRLYHHLLDPASGRPADTGLTAVTVVCPSAFWADILSTAVFLLGRQQGEALLRRTAPFTGALGAVYLEGGEVHLSENLARHYAPCEHVKG